MWPLCTDKHAPHPPLCPCVRLAACMLSSHFWSLDWFCTREEGRTPPHSFLNNLSIGVHKGFTYIKTAMFLRCFYSHFPTGVGHLPISLPQLLCLVARG